MADQIPEAGKDPDSRLRELKHNLATAEAAGDAKATDRLRGEVDSLNVEAGRKDKPEAKQKPGDKKP